MEKIVNWDQKKLDIFAKENCFLGSGAEGTAYKMNNGYVIKILDGFDDREYTEEQYLKFSDLEVDSYYFAKQVIYVDNKIAAYIMKQCKGENLLESNPFSIKLDKLMLDYDKMDTDTKILSLNKIQGYDMIYNFIYGRNGFGAIDTAEYKYCNNMDDKKIYEFNIGCFQYELAQFLIDGCFDKFVSSNKDLSELYSMVIQYGIVIDFKEFLVLFKNKVSEYCGKNITCLQDGKKAIRLVRGNYMRSFDLEEGVNKIK